LCQKSEIAKITTIGRSSLYKERFLEKGETLMAKKLNQRKPDTSEPKQLKKKGMWVMPIPDGVEMVNGHFKKP